MILKDGSVLNEDYIVYVRRERNRKGVFAVLKMRDSSQSSAESRGHWDLDEDEYNYVVDLFTQRGRT